MSYILDALKKSDQQRQRGATPTLPTAHAPVSASRQSFSVYYGVLAGVLLCAGIAIGWLHPWQTEEPGRASAPVAMKPVISDTSPRPDPIAMPRQTEQSLPPVTPAPAYPTGEPARAADTGQEQRVVAQDELPASIRQEIPEMQIQLHSYYSKSANSIVSINSRMMKEGESLAPGLKLEQITADGVILGYKGYRFRLGIR